MGNEWMHANSDMIEKVAADLDAAAAALEALDGGTPTGIDAGLMGPIVNPLIAQVVNGAANVSTGMDASAQVARESSRYYRRADAEIMASAEDISKAMEVK